MLPQALLDDVKKSFGRKLQEPVRLALQLQEMTGEMIVSRDLSVVVAPVDAPFDPDLMVDEWVHPTKGKSGPVQPHPVLCTTQLGLIREEVRAEGDGTGMVVENTILLKPTVVLASMFEELWDDNIQANANRKQQRST